MANKTTGFDAKKLAEKKAANAAKVAEDAKILAEENKTTEPTPEKTEVDKKSSTQIDFILEELAKLKAENKEMKDDLVHPSVKGKEINEDHKLFSYKLWAGKPVLSYVSKKIDPSRDLVYKNIYGTYESNHVLELTFSDESTLDVEVNEFNGNFEKSEKLPALDHHNEPITNDNLKLVKSYTFTVGDEKFTVLPNLIN